VGALAPTFRIVAEIMTITQLWYLIIFAWGIVCGWAVVKGISNH